MILTNLTPYTHTKARKFYKRMHIFQCSSSRSHLIFFLLPSLFLVCLFAYLVLHCVQHRIWNEHIIFGRHTHCEGDPRERKNGRKRKSQPRKTMVRWRQRGELGENERGSSFNSVYFTFVFTHKYEYRPHWNYAGSEWADGMKCNEIEQTKTRTHTTPRQTKTIYPYVVNFD